MSSMRNGDFVLFSGERAGSHVIPRTCAFVDGVMRMVSYSVPIVNLPSTSKAVLGEPVKPENRGKRGYCLVTF